MSTVHQSSTPADAGIAPGTVLFNAYEIVSEIGGGAMGRVYCARHLNFGELRAVKVVRRGTPDQAELEERLVREAKSLIKLTHDAVVRCFELLRDEERLCLVMEYVEGPSLQRLLLRGPLPDDEVLALASRVDSGLRAIHGAGVTHRDVSPANIVLPDGQPERAKIVDFGVADGASSDGRRGFTGNPAYASPEQYGLFGGRVGPASDFYGLGLVLAESTIGEPLDHGTTPCERRAFRQQCPALPDYVAPEVRQTIAPLLEPDPDRRPRSIADARARASGPAAGSMGEVSANRHVAAGVPRWRTVVFCASAVVLGLMIGALAWMWREAQWFKPPVQAAGRVVVAQPGRSSPPAANTQVAPSVGAAKAASSPIVAGTPSPPAPLPAPPPRRSVTPGAPSPTTLDVSRAESVATAERLASFTWSPSASNLEARCQMAAPYKSRWQAGQPVSGIPYAWGHIDGPDEFTAKRQRGLTTGSHSYHGVSDCAAGIDCSGFVTFCWGLRGTHKYATATLHRIADPVAGHVADSLAPGDALNNPGRHVLLFAGYQPDGRPILFEAAGRPGRVVKRLDLSWSRLRAYSPMRLRTIRG